MISTFDLTPFLNIGGRATPTAETAAESYRDRVRYGAYTWRADVLEQGRTPR